MRGGDVIAVTPEDVPGHVHFARQIPIPRHPVSNAPSQSDALWVLPYPLGYSSPPSRLDNGYVGNSQLS